MTVKQLKKKLNKMPDDASICFVNTDSYINGLYLADKVEYLEIENVVEIVSNHTKLFYEL